jgi:hypothetical protein
MFCKSVISQELDEGASSPYLRIAVIMRDHHRGIQRLKIKHDYRAFVERRLGLHDEWLTFCGILTSNLRERQGRLSIEDCAG